MVKIALLIFTGLVSFTLYFIIDFIIIYTPGKAFELSKLKLILISLMCIIASFLLLVDDKDEFN